jgi:ribonuclease P protein component
VKRFSFPKSRRLVSNRQFRAVLSHGLCFSDGLLILYIARNDCGYPRLGVSVGKSCGGAVVRNRLKRLLREAFRQSQNLLPASCDYLLMISPKWLQRTGESDSRKAARRLTFEQARSSLLTIVIGAIGRIG